MKSTYLNINYWKRAAGRVGMVAVRAGLGAVVALGALGGGAACLDGGEGGTGPDEGGRWGGEVVVRLERRDGGVGEGSEQLSPGKGDPRASADREHLTEKGDVACSLEGVFTVDRVLGEWAVLISFGEPEGPCGQVEIPLVYLPPGVREGDVLVDGRVSREEGERIRSEINGLLEELMVQNSQGEDPDQWGGGSGDRGVIEL